MVESSSTPLQRGGFLIPAAVLSIAAGAVHASAAGAHIDGAALRNLFAVAAIAQLGAGTFLLIARSQKAVAVAATINLAVALAWAMSRTIGLPLPAELRDVQPVGGQDLAAAVIAVAAAGAAILSGRTHPSWRARLVGDMAVLVAIGVGLIAVAAGHEHATGKLDQSVPLLDAGAFSDRLPPQQAAALLGVAARPVLGDGHDHGQGESDGHGSGYIQPPPPAALAGEDATRFDEHWARAHNATVRLATIEDAAADGYVKAAAPVPGVGEHWVKWSLVDQPFDPAAPSMLLFDVITSGRPPQLVGLSYWVASPDEPDGFAGPNDEWHTHQGLCFVNGWLRQEGVQYREDCGDTWLDGTDLWMLHAWPVDGLDNPWGPFAPINPRLCFNRAQTPDALSCNPVGQ